MGVSCQRCWFKSTALLWGLAFSLASLSAEPNPPLRFLGNADLPPMVWNHNGTTQGVAVDLVKAAASKVDLPVSVVGTDWQKAQDELREGTADALIQINPIPSVLLSTTSRIHCSIRISTYSAE